MTTRDNGAVGRRLLAATLLLTPFQIYTVAIGEVYLPLVLVLALSLFVFYDSARLLKTSITMQCWAALMLLEGISLLWSISAREGIREIIYSLPFFVVFAACMHESRRNPRFVISILIAYSVLTLAQSALIIFFRFEPDIKMQYLQGRLAEIFANPSTINDLFGDVRNNVLDPDKSGGFEANANSGAAWVGLVGMVTIGLAVALRRKWLLIIGVVHMAAIAFTGSKAAIMVACSMVGMMWLTMFISRKMTPTRLALLVLCVVVLASLGAVVVTVGASTDFGQSSSDTLDSRKLIWAHAATEFTKNPIFGQGFGGWSASFQSYAWQQKIPDYFPPHDTFIRLWSQSGVLAVLLGAAFMIAFSMEMLKLIRSGSRIAAWIGAGIWCGFLFISIQGLGENWGLFGTLRMSPYLAACFALSRVLSYHVQPIKQHPVLHTFNGQIEHV
ncbi:MAG TPA: O-antigen ligase family protein [Paraburkholderia sp.]